jgi:hypothetical protein
VRINALVAKAQKTPDEGWIMQDGTPWPGNNPRDHPGMIQVVCFLLVKYQRVRFVVILSYCRMVFYFQFGTDC